jgi:hypothetical protein
MVCPYPSSPYLERSLGQTLSHLKTFFISFNPPPPKKIYSTPIYIFFISSLCNLYFKITSVRILNLNLHHLLIDLIIELNVNYL